LGVEQLASDVVLEQRQIALSPADGAVHVISLVLAGDRVDAACNRDVTDLPTLHRTPSEPYGLTFRGNPYLA
jgi:hypothetical protein